MGRKSHMLPNLNPSNQSQLSVYECVCATLSQRIRSGEGIGKLCVCVCVEGG